MGTALDSNSFSPFAPSVALANCEFAALFLLTLLLIALVLIRNRSVALARLRESARDLATRDEWRTEFEQLFSSGTWEEDLAEGTFRVSTNAKTLLGLSESETVPTRDALLRLIPAQDALRLKNARTTAVRTERAYCIEFSLPLPNGSVRRLREQGSATRRPSELRGWLRAVIFDITQTIHHAADGCETETSTTQLLGYLACPIVVAEIASNAIVFSNPALECLCGFSGAELRQRLFHGEASSALVSFEDGEPKDANAWPAKAAALLHKSDGGSTPVHTVATSIRLNSRSYTLIQFSTPAQSVSRNEAIATKGWVDSLLHAQDAGVAILDPLGKVIECNRWWRDVLGQSDLVPGLGSFLQCIASDDDQSALEQARANLISRKQHHELRTVRFKHTSNIERDVHVWLIPITDNNSDVFQILVLGIDCDPLARAKVQLREPEARLSLITRTRDMGTWTWNIKDDRLIWDETLCHLYGLQSFGFEGHADDWNRSIHAADLALVTQAHVAALRDDRETSYEFRIVRPDGAIRHMEAVAKAIRDISGTPVMMVGINIDVTTRRQLETHRLREEARLSALVRLHALEPTHESELLAFAAGEIRQLLLADETQILVVHNAPVESAAEVRAPRGSESDWIDTLFISQNAHFPLAIECAKTLAPVIHNAATLASPTANKTQIDTSTNELCLPMLERDKVTAVVRVTRKGVPFSNEDLHQLQVFASNIGQVLLRFRAERAVRETSIRLHIILENLHAGVIIVNRHSIIEFANDRFCELLGLAQKAEQLIGITSTEMVSVITPALRNHELDGQRIREAIDRDTHVYDQEVQLSNGKLLVCDHIPFVVDGQVHGRVWTTRDVTAVRAAQEQRHLNERRLESIYRVSQHQAASSAELLDFALDEAIELSDSKIGYIFRYDEKSQLFTLSTFSKSVMTKCKIIDVKSTYELAETGLWGEPVRQRKAIVHNDFSIPHPLSKGIPAGHAAIHRYMTIPVIVEDHIVGVVGVANKDTEYEQTDVLQLTLLMDGVWKLSDRLQAQSSLLQAKQQAEEASRIKTAFLSSMSHELRTPMNAILGLVHLTLRTELNGQQRDYLNRLQVAAQSLLGLLNDTLDLSKIEAGKMDAEKVPFVLMDVVRGVQGLMVDRATKKGLALTLTADESLPHRVIGDALRLGQVLSNLVGNAVKFTEHGSVAISIVAAKDEPKVIRFSIQDTGIGLNETQLAELFQPFKQAESSTTRRYGGTGLGLAISKNLVELMGGHMKVESRPGHGSTFSFALPLPAAPASTTLLTVRPSHWTVTSPERVNRILVADADHSALLHSEQLLFVAGYEVERASTGEQALQLLLSADSTLNAALIDLHLPGISGLEVVRKVREAGLTLPLVTLSQEDPTNPIVHLPPQGANGHLVKPFEPDTLYMVLEQWIALSANGQTESHLESHTLQAIKPIEGFDLTLPLQRLGGKEALLHKLLALFRRDVQRLREGLEAALRSTDWESIRLLAHNLKGVAGNVGAQKLGQLARDLEQCARSTDETEANQLMRQISEHFEEILAAVGEPSTEPFAAQNSIRPLSDGLRASLTKLDALLQRKSLDAVKLLATLKPELGTVGQPSKVAALTRAVEGLEFPQARVLVAQLLEKKVS